MLPTHRPSKPAASAPGKQGLPRGSSFQRAASAGKSLADLVRGRSPSPARASAGPRSNSPAAATRIQSSSKGSRATSAALGGQRRRGDPGTVMDPTLVMDMYSDLLPAQSPLHTARLGGAMTTAAARYAAPHLLHSARLQGATPAQRIGCAIGCASTALLLCLGCGIHACKHACTVRCDES